MRVLGVDPSSSIAGLALVDGGELVLSKTWKPHHKNESPVKRLRDWYDFIFTEMSLLEPDLLVIEIIAFAKSHTVTRILSRYEAAAIIAAHKHSVTVKEHRVSEARAIVWPGKGNMSKQDAFKLTKQMFPDHDFGTAKSGGYDRADATVMALAGPELVEK